MHIQFAQYFVDPVTREPLQLHIDERQGDTVITGALYSSSSRYPIVRGVPRFVTCPTEENYSKNFGYQWNKWSTLQFDSRNQGGPMQGYSSAMWEKITGQTGGLEGQVVLDIGCGSGRFIEVVRKKGGKVVGLDYSLAVEAAHENFKADPDVCIVQGDALALPFRPGCFDAAYSIGVLHHTPNPVLGVQESSRVVRSGGWFGLCVYGRGGYYDFPSVQLWRKVFQVLWPLFGPYPALVYSYSTVYLLRPFTKLGAFGKLIRLVLPFVNLPDIRWSLLDTFDSVTPSYQSAHESFEVFRWLRENGYDEVEPSNWGFTAYHGRKREAIQEAA